MLPANSATAFIQKLQEIGLYLRVARDFADTPTITGAAEGLAEHRAILNALRSGDAGRARTAAANHLRNGFRRVCSRFGIEDAALSFDPSSTCQTQPDPPES